jgi:hypothetical protein
MNLHVGADVASGQTKVVGNDPWMVPERRSIPSESDSKWVALTGRLRSLYHVIFIANARPARRAVTDGLSDAVWPA